MECGEVLLRMFQCYDGSADQPESCSTAVKSRPRNQPINYQTVSGYPGAVFLCLSENLE